jgi:hypothetical protein
MAIHSSQVSTNLVPRFIELLLIVLHNVRTCIVQFFSLKRIQRELGEVKVGDGKRAWLL